MATREAAPASEATSASAAATRGPAAAVPRAAATTGPAAAIARAAATTGPVAAVPRAAAGCVCARAWSLAPAAGPAVGSRATRAGVGVSWCRARPCASIPAVSRWNRGGGGTAFQPRDSRGLGNIGRVHRGAPSLLTAAPEAGRGNQTSQQRRALEARHLLSDGSPHPHPLTFSPWATVRSGPGPGYRAPGPCARRLADTPPGGLPPALPCGKGAPAVTPRAADCDFPGRGRARRLLSTGDGHS